MTAALASMLRRSARRGALCAAILTSGAFTSTPDGAADVPPPPWGFRGHEMATRVAVESLPSEMPGFFAQAADQLIFLAPEPDRWRVRSSVEMAQAWSYDHYIDFENVPDGALEAPDRFSYLYALRDAGVDAPEADGGLLPFRIIELHQRITSLWARWHDASDTRQRRWIEERIIQDAGILAHYVTDGSQPHHTTIHFNGWADGAANPESFTRDRSFHSRFERDYVDAHITADDIRVRVGPVGAAFAESRPAVMEYLLATHETVQTLYRLDRDAGFDPRTDPDPAAHSFAVERLASGSRMLAALWWTAYVDGIDKDGERSAP